MSNVCTGSSGSGHQVVDLCCEIDLSPLKPGVNKVRQEIEGPQSVRKLLYKQFIINYHNICNCNADLEEGISRNEVRGVMRRNRYPNPSYAIIL